MKIQNILSRSIFSLRWKVVIKITNFFRKKYYRLIGMKIGEGTILFSALDFTWPNRISIGNYVKLEEGISFKFDGIYQPGPRIVIGNNVFIGKYCEFNITHSITIGTDSLIASGCKFIDHNHGISKSEIMRLQQCPGKSIVIGNNVWLGVNTVVLMGVNSEDHLTGKTR